MISRWMGPGLMAAVLMGACDPSAETGRSKDDTLLRRAGPDPDPAIESVLERAKVVVRQDGAIEIYGHDGQLRAQILDPKARFVSTLEPLAGPLKFGDAHPTITVRAGGLAELLIQRGKKRKAKAELEAKGLVESQRTMIAIAESVEATERALGTLDGELEALWADPTLPLGRRRELLFERWDECEEGDGSTRPPEIVEAKQAVDAIRGHTGDLARARIVAFIRKELPRGSADAFTPSEVERLDRRRRSTRRFDPYGEGDTGETSVGPSEPP